MSIKNGEITVSRVYEGNTPIVKIYKGETLIFSMYEINWSGNSSNGSNSGSYGSNTSYGSSSTVRITLDSVNSSTGDVQITIFTQWRSNNGNISGGDSGNISPTIPGMTSSTSTAAYQAVTRVFRFNIENLIMGQTYTASASAWTNKFSGGGYTVNPSSASCSSTFSRK